MTYSDEPEFTKDDLGKYKHPETVAEVPYAELEARALAAIDAGYRTLPRLKEYAGVERKHDISDLITGMELDEKIRRCENGTFTAFFRFEQMPKRFWICDGKIEAEFVEDFKPSSKFKELGASNSRAVVNPETNSRSYNERTKVSITPEQMEKAATEHKTTLDIAQAVGYSNTTSLSKRMKQEPDLQAAYDRGRQAFAKNQDAARSTHSTIPEPVTSPVAHATGPRNPNTGNEHLFDKKPMGRAPIDIDPQKLEDAIAEHGTWKLAAKALDIGYSTLYTKIGASPYLKDAAERGRERFNESKRAAMPDEEAGRAKSAMSPAEARNLVISTAAFKDYAAAGKSLNDLAKDNGVARATVYNRAQKPENQAAWNEGVRMYKAAKHGTEPVEVNMSSHSRKRIEITDLVKVEELAASGISVQKAAGELGVGYKTLLKHVNGYSSQKSVHSAWLRGVNRRAKNDKVPAKETSKGSKNYREYTADEIEQISSVEASLIDIAKTVGVGQAAFSRWLKDNPDIRAAYDRGRAKYRETNPVSTKPRVKFEGEIERFPAEPVRAQLDEQLKETVEPQQTPSNEYRSTIGMELEPEQMIAEPKQVIHVPVREAREIEVFPAQTPAANPSILTLSNGSQLAVGFNGNFFGLSKAEREMMMGIADLLTVEAAA